MSAILQRFHQVANDALVNISEHCLPGAKIALVIYTPGRPEEDIVLKDQGLDDNEVVSVLRRRGLSIDGDNAYKRDLLDSAVGAMAFGVQNRNPPPAGHWGQRFWDIGREERALCEELVAANPKVVVDVKAGKMQAAGAFVGQAKKKNPNANPARVRELCLEIIAKLP